MYTVFLLLSCRRCPYTSTKFPQTVCTHWGRWKSRCLIRVFTQVCGIVRINFIWREWFLWDVDMRFDCAASHQVRRAVCVCGILPENWCLKWLLWNFDMRFHCANSHKLCGAFLVCGILLVTFRITVLLWILTRVSTAQARTKSAAFFWFAACYP